MIKTLLILFLFLIFSSTIFATDNTIICPNSDSDCYFQDSNSLLNLDKIYPGFTSIQNLKIINERKNDDCNLEFNIKHNSGSDPLLDKVSLTVSDDQTVLLTKNLSELLDNNSHSLGTILKDSNKELLWTVSFDKDIDNSLQNLNTNFDFNFNFICDTVIETPPIITVLTNLTKPLTTIKQIQPQVLGADDENKQLLDLSTPEISKIDYPRWARYFCLLGIFSILVYFRSRKSK